MHGRFRVVTLQEVMYDKNSVLIAVILFVTMIAAVEFGSWVGLRLSARANDSLRSQVNSLQASLLGILALLLGFTFSQSLQRYDLRSAAVVSEANAIGTAQLRVALLPDAYRRQTFDLMNDYIESRIDAGAVSLDREAARQLLARESERIQAELWQLAAAAVHESDRPATVNLYLAALNDMIDAKTSRDAALGRHVPEIVLFLLYGTFILTGVLVGYAAGVSGARASRGTYVLVGLIVVLVFIIIDLDRPRRGLIEVDQSSLVALGTAMIPSDSIRPE